MKKMVVIGIVLLILGVEFTYYGINTKGVLINKVDEIVKHPNKASSFKIEEFSKHFDKSLIFTAVGVVLVVVGIAMVVFSCIRFRQKSKSVSKKEMLYRISVSAMMVALSTVLSLVKVWQMPLGGSITLLSMVPVCSIAILYGPKTAFGPCILYGFLQMMLDGIFGWGLTAGILIGSINFDYLLAFGLLCLAGLFRKKGNVGILIGVGIAVVARFCSHLVSGFIFFRSFDVFNNPYIYSICYNGAYMLPELIITLAGIIILNKANFFKRLNKMVAKS